MAIASVSVVSNFASGYDYGIVFCKCVTVRFGYITVPHCNAVLEMMKHEFRIVPSKPIILLPSLHSIPRVT